MSKKAFRPGQSVTFQFGSRSAQGVIKENRGPIGMKGRVLYLVAFRPEVQSSNVSHIELPVDQLEELESTVTTENRSPTN